MRAEATGSTGVGRPRVISWPGAAFVAVLLAGFLYIAVQAAVGGWLVAWDVEVTATVVAARTAAWSRVLWVFTLLGNTPVMAALTAMTAVLLAMWGRWTHTVLVVGAVASATGVSQLLKAVLQRIRPPETLALIDAPGSYSLPSGHALVTGVFLGLLLMLALRLSAPVSRVVAGIVAVGVAGLVGFSRIYLGVHWTSDVLAGWCVAGIWLAVVLAVFRWWQRSAGAATVARPWRDARWRAVIAAVLALAAAAVLVVEALTEPLLA